MISDPTATAPNGDQDRITGSAATCPHGYPASHWIGLPTGSDPDGLCPGPADAVELVLRHHLPVRVGDDGPVLCICDVLRTYEGPVAHRLHVVAELREAGLLRV